MILAIEVVGFLIGLYTLVTGRFKLTKDRIVMPPHSRIVGAILMIPGILVIILLTLFASGQEFADADLIRLLEAGVAIGALVIAGIIAYTAPRAAPTT